MRHSIQDEARNTEIDLWGHVYELVPITKKNEDEINSQIAEINEKIESAVSHTDLIASLGEKYDLTLKPVAGERKKPSKLLDEKWAAGGVTVAQAIRFFTRIEATELRPT